MTAAVIKAAVPRRPCQPRGPEPRPERDPRARRDSAPIRNEPGELTDRVPDLLRASVLRPQRDRRPQRQVRLINDLSPGPPVPESRHTGQTRPHRQKA
jgi:hypothetical protein